MPKKITIILTVIILLYLSISFWEHDDVLGFKMDDSKLYVIHKRYKGYSIFSLNIDAGSSPATLNSDVYVSTWTLNENTSGLSYKLVSDWKKIASRSGDWYPMVYKVAGTDSYAAFHNISSNKKYLTRYTFAADTLTSESRNLECADEASEICYVPDRYAKYYLSNGVIYNTIDFGVFKSLSGKNGYEQFKNKISEARNIFSFRRLFLSSDTKYLFGLSSCKKSQTIFVYNIDKDETDEITLKNYELGCAGSTYIEDIDTNGGAIYLILDPGSDDSSPANKPHKYIVYDFSNSVEYPIAIKDYYYGTSRGMWDVKNHTIYALNGSSVDDTDKAFVYGYISEEFKQINLDPLNLEKW